MSETPTNHNKRKLTVPQRLVIATAASLLIAGAAKVGGSPSPESRRTDDEAKTLNQEANKGFEVVNELIVLRPGVQYRKTPNVVPAESKDGSDSGSVAGKVEDGKLLVINRPFVYEGQDGKSWYGFKMKTEPNTSDKISDKTLADQTYWIDMTTLNTQHDKAGAPYYDTYVSGTTDNAHPIVHGAYDKAGNIIIDDGSTGTLAAQAAIMDADQANFLISNASAGRLMK